MTDKSRGGREDSTEWYDDPAFWFPEKALPARPCRVRPGVFGNGRLASTQDLEALLAPPGPGEHALRLSAATLLVEATPDGSALRPLLHRDLTLPAPLMERHLLMVGTTGAGKTQKLILPLLAAAIADPQRTVIAVDAKGGVLFDFARALALRHRPGQAVQQVNLRHRPGQAVQPGDASPHGSALVEHWSIRREKGERRARRAWTRSRLVDEPPGRHPARPAR